MKRVNAKMQADLLAQALEHHRAGRFAQAGSLYQAILDKEPDHAGALHFKGVLAWQGGQLADAAALIGRSLTLSPGQAQAHSNLGNVWRAMGRHADAAKSYQRAVELQPDNPDVWTNLGVALRELKQLDAAEAAYRRAIELRPDSPVALNNLGNLLLDAGLPEEALACFERAVVLNPQYADAWSNRGNAFLILDLLEQAVESCDRALDLQPGLPRAHLNLGVALLGLQQFADAAAAFAVAYAFTPHEPFLLGNLLLARQSCGDWADHDALVQVAETQVLAGAHAAMAWGMLMSSDNPQVQQMAARITVKRLTSVAHGPLWHGQTYAHDRIRVAYLSSDFHNHATSYLAARLFELHDSQRFDVYLVALKRAEPDDMLARLKKCPVTFVEAAEMSDEAVAQWLQANEIDIAVDLHGLTGNSRIGILARRAVPLQVSYLGYPGTMGAPFIDYLIADHVLVPPGAAQYFDEQVVRLPDSYQVNDNTRWQAEATPTRAHAGLPAEGFVFCCFNKTAKITPKVFAVWARLLRRVPGSVLWLFSSDASAMGNLRREAQAHGVAPERLVFAPRAPQAEHLARHRLADLVLDTLPYNAHTTASDALWAGVPMVTCKGESFVSRVGASLLHAVGLAELITDDLAAYEALAFELSQSPDRLNALRQQLSTRRANLPLFDSDRFRLHLESAYLQMVERQRQGLAPQAFDVEPIA